MPQRFQIADLVSDRPRAVLKQSLLDALVQQVGGGFRIVGMEQAARTGDLGYH